MIPATCLEVRRALDERRADESIVRDHLAGCAGCRAHAHLLESLAHLEVGDASDAAVERVMAGLPPAPWRRRRVATWLPLAAGLGLMGTGLALLGGVPAPSAVAALPGLAGGALAWAASATLDALAAARGSVDAVHALVAAQGLSMLASLIFAAAGGGWAVRALVRSRHRGEQS